MVRPNVWTPRGWRERPRSLPTPLSPRSRTAASVMAMFSTIPRTVHIAALPRDVEEVGDIALRQGVRGPRFPCALPWSLLHSPCGRLSIDHPRLVDPMSKTLPTKRLTPCWFATAHAVLNSPSPIGGSWIMAFPSAVCIRRVHDRSHGPIDDRAGPRSAYDGPGGCGRRRRIIRVLLIEDDERVAELFGMTLKRPARHGGMPQR